MKRLIVTAILVALFASAVPSAQAGGGSWAVKVDGTSGRAMVTWGNIGATHQATVSLPWRHRVPVDGSFDVVTIVGQRQSGGTGRIVCLVLHNGVIVQRARSSGPYAVCQASEST
jgi:hypothetical protein